MSSNKNEVFEYLIDQLRRQINKKDVTSFNVSVQISDLDEVKQVIHNLQQHIAGKDDEIRALKDSLRQQVNSNPCEDLAHEVLSLKSELARYKKPYIAYVKKTDWVQGDSRFLDKWGKHRADILRECIQEQDAEIQSLKNQLRDASAQIKELTCALDCAENEVMCLRSIVDLDPKGAIGYIRRANSAMTDTMRRQYLSKALEELGCKDAPEKSGCRKEGAQECEHSWIIMPGLFLSEGNPDNVPGSELCSKCGKREWDDEEYKPKNDTSECEHDWDVDGDYAMVCKKCGALA